MGRYDRTIQERMDEKIDKSGGPDACWPWLAGTDKEGYGTIKINGAVRKAHRVSFFLEHGRWPEPCGLHECDNPPCCNPKHIFEGTRKDNNDDRDRKGRKSPFAIGGDKFRKISHPVNSCHPTGSWNVGKDNPIAKLTEDNVREIRRLRQQGMKYPAIASLFGISKSTARHVASGRYWHHIE